MFLESCPELSTCSPIYVGQATFTRYGIYHAFMSILFKRSSILKRVDLSVVGEALIPSLHNSLIKTRVYGPVCSHAVVVVVICY